MLLSSNWGELERASHYRELNLLDLLYDNNVAMYVLYIVSYFLANVLINPPLCMCIAGYSSLFACLSVSHALVLQGSTFSSLTKDINL